MQLDGLNGRQQHVDKIHVKTSLNIVVGSVMYALLVPLILDQNLSAL